MRSTISPSATAVLAASPGWPERAGHVFRCHTPANMWNLPQLMMPSREQLSAANAGQGADWRGWTLRRVRLARPIAASAK